MPNHVTMQAARESPVQGQLCIIRMDGQGTGLWWHNQEAMGGWSQLAVRAHCH